MIHENESIRQCGKKYVLAFSPSAERAAILSQTMLCGRVWSKGLWSRRYHRVTQVLTTHSIDSGMYTTLICDTTNSKPQQPLVLVMN